MSEMFQPGSYEEKVYAGVLGKIIGVYLGRPFEGWSHERILRELGEVDAYVHQAFNQPLVVTDDDIAGTFTFLRALEDANYDPDLTPAQIGDAWLNYLIENRTVLWWGGLGMSTEHTAYMRLRSGMSAPMSGSSATNGRIIAEQIGAQIFIDGWAMLFPGDPERAVEFARRAARVSHDGEAVYGAQIIAALEAMAFVESDMNVLFDTAVSLIPSDSTIATLIRDIRAWHAQDTGWRETLGRIQEHYGYDKFGGNCHIVPNHALIILALLYGGGDFRRSLMIANTSGWDTDCNSGNVGAILGIRNGLAGIDAGPVDWRGPVADRMYLPTADGGRAITDAAREALFVINASRALHQEPALAPKSGARFHFAFPGCVQGFQADDPSALDLGNEGGRLTLRLQRDGESAATTPVFIPPEAQDLGGYTLLACPTLYPGQTVATTLLAPATNAGAARATVLLRTYGEDDALVELPGPRIILSPGDTESVTWTIPDTGGQPVQSVGFRLIGTAGTSLHIDRIDWSGAPCMTLGAPDAPTSMWRRMWIDAVDLWHVQNGDYVCTQNRGTGVLSLGTADWEDYTVRATVTVPLADSAGIAARIGGLRRNIALVLDGDGMARLVRADGERTVLAETPFTRNPDQAYKLELQVQGASIRGRIDGEIELTAIDPVRSPRGGGAGLVITEGTIIAGPLTICG